MENENAVPHRKLQITLNSASNLPNVRSYSQMKVYATVRIGEILETRQTTPTDMKGETNPVWNYSTEYLISETDVQQAAGLKVIIELYCKCSLKKDKPIGLVGISINELFNTWTDGTRNRISRLDEGNGVVNLSYNFGDVINVARDGVGDGVRPRRWRRYIGSAANFFGKKGGIVTAAGLLVPDDQDVPSDQAGQDDPDGPSDQADQDNPDGPSDQAGQDNPDEPDDV